MANLNDMLAKSPKERLARVQKMADEMILDYKLYQLREELELSQKQLAEAMGITQPTLSAIENRGAEIKMSTLKRYVETMGGKLRIDVELPTGKHVGFNI